MIQMKLMLYMKLASIMQFPSFFNVFNMRVVFWRYHRDSQSIMVYTHHYWCSSLGFQPNFKANWRRSAFVNRNRRIRRRRQPSSWKGWTSRQVTKQLNPSNVESPCEIFCCKRRYWSSESWVTCTEYLYYVWYVVYIERDGIRRLVHFFGSANYLQGT